MNHVWAIIQVYVNLSTARTDSNQQIQSTWVEHHLTCFSVALIYSKIASCDSLIKVFDEELEIRKFVYIL